MKEEHYVVIEKLCSCARKRNLVQIRAFESKEEAEDHSYEWAENLNNTFCGRHSFSTVEVDENYVISVEKGGFFEMCDI